MRLKLTGTFTDNTLPAYRRDAVLSGDNGGVKFLFDLAYPYSYAGGTPANGSPIVNINDSGSNGSIVLTSGQNLVFAGNGLDFTNITAANNYLSVPASVAADIWGGGAGLQYFMQVMYLKLPTNANWNVDTSIVPFSQFATTAYNIPDADLVLFNQQASGKAIGARRQTNGATIDTLSVVPMTADYGSYAQVAFWRNAAGQGLRLKTANGTVLSTAAVGSANVTNFSAKTGKIGLAGTFAPGVQAPSRQWKLYRGWIENLVTSGRDPATVLDADWTRTVARGVFS